VTYHAAPPIHAPMSRAQIGVLDRVFGLAEHEFEDALRALSTPRAS